MKQLIVLFAILVLADGAAAADLKLGFKCKTLDPENNFDQATVTVEGSLTRSWMSSTGTSLFGVPGDEVAVTITVPGKDGKDQIFLKRKLWLGASLNTVLNFRLNLLPLPYSDDAVESIRINFDDGNAGTITSGVSLNETQGNRFYSMYCGN